MGSFLLALTLLGCAFATVSDSYTNYNNLELNTESSIGHLQQLAAENESPSSDIRQGFSDQLDRELISELNVEDRDSSFFNLLHFNSPSEDTIEINQKAQRILEAAKTLQNRFSALSTIDRANS